MEVKKRSSSSRRVVLVQDDNRGRDDEVNKSLLLFILQLTDSIHITDTSTRERTSAQGKNRNRDTIETCRIEFE